MKKNYKKPLCFMYYVDTLEILCNSYPNDKWHKNENDEWVNPGGHINPGHGHRTKLWEDN